MSLKYFTIEERLNANAWDVDVHRPHIKIVDLSGVGNARRSLVLLCVPPGVTCDKATTWC